MLSVSITSAMSEIFSTKITGQDNIIPRLVGERGTHRRHRQRRQEPTPSL